MKVKSDDAVLVRWFLGSFTFTFSFDTMLVCWFLCSVAFSLPADSCWCHCTLASTSAWRLSRLPNFGGGYVRVPLEAQLWSPSRPNYVWTHSTHGGGPADFLQEGWAALFFSPLSIQPYLSLMSLRCTEIMIFWNFMLTTGQWPAHCCT